MIKESLIGEFQRVVGKENVLTKKEALRAYSYDGTTSWIHEPDVVVFPRTTKEISDIMKIANAEKIPVTPSKLPRSFDTISWYTTSNL